MSPDPTRPLSDTLFIQEFRDFCRSKGDESYDFADSIHCALGQFGYPCAYALPLGEIPEIVLRIVAQNCSRRFSALADRLDTLIASAPALLEALETVLQYRRGEGKFNFSTLTTAERENAQFDAWEEVESLCDAAINLARGAQ